MPDRVRRAQRLRVCRRPFLQTLGLSEVALQIGGAVVLMLVALRMVFPSPEGVYGQAPGGSLHRASGRAGPGGPSALATC